MTLLRPSRGQFISQIAATSIVLAASPVLAETAPSAVNIAHLPGIGYMPFIVMKMQNRLAKRWPQTAFSWQEVSPTVTTDGIITGRLQIAATGTTAFLIGVEKGVPWKMLCSANTSDLPCVVIDPKIRSIADLKPTDKIAVPSLTSSQTLVLRKGLQNAGLDPHSLDTAFVALEPPDAVQALLSRQITAHMSAPPFYQTEVQKGARIILHSKDVFGVEATMAVAVANTGFAQQYPQFVADFMKEYADAADFVRAHPDDAAKIYVADTEGKADLSETTEILRSSGGYLFRMTPRGVLQIGALMKQMGQLQNVPASMASMEFAGKAVAGSD